MITAKAANATANAVNKSQAERANSSVVEMLCMLEGRIKEFSKKGFFYIHWSPLPFATNDTVASVICRLKESGYTIEEWGGAWLVKWSDIAE